MQPNPAFKHWVRRPYGIPLLQEDTFANIVTAGHPKWGTFLTAGGAVAQDTTQYWGGTGSAKLTTNAATNAGTEIKTSLSALFEQGDLLAFEAKFSHTLASASTKIQLGLESRSHADIKQARVQYTVGTAKWQYESAANTYSDFTPAAAVEKNVYDAAAGSALGWMRIVIDPHSKYWHSFEAPYNDGTDSYLKRWDMSGVPLCINGSSGAGGAILLPFAYIIAGSASAEVMYTTDWCMSVIPAYQRRTIGDASAGLQA
jgi:hypothetical protein